MDLRSWIIKNTVYIQYILFLAIKFNTPLCNAVTKLQNITIQTTKFGNSLLKPNNFLFENLILWINGFFFTFPNINIY